MISPLPFRRHVANLLDWEEAHVGVPAAFEGVAPELRGRVPEGVPYSLWQLLEHLRTAQRDLLDFCFEAEYQAPRWPEDYWPAEPAPPHENAWEESLAGLRADLEALKALALDPAVDLLAPVPTGSEGQTYLRTFLLAADHTAYHVGQAVLVRRLLGVWPAG
jgi:uncharacterized damage-inducible protein DinB